MKSASGIASPKFAGIGESIVSRFLSMSFVGMRISFPSVVRDDQHLALDAEHESGDGPLVLGGDDPRAERLIDVPVRVERVFEEPFQPAGADAVELRGDLPARIADRWHAAQCLVKSFAPSSLSGLADANAVARFFMSSAIF